MIADEVDTDTPAFNAGLAIMDNLPADQCQKLGAWLKEHEEQ